MLGKDKDRLKAAFRRGSHLPYLAIIALSSLIIFRDYWLYSKIFTGSDFVREMVPLPNFQSDCLRELSWPLWNPYMNFGYPYVEHFLNTTLFPSHLVLGFLFKYNTYIAQVEVLGWILLGGIGIYLCVVEYGYSRVAAAISAMAYMFSGQVIALPQWGIVVYTACCFPFLLLGYARAKRFGRPYSLISALFLALSFLGGYMASAPLGMYFLIGYVLIDSFIEKRFVFGLKFLFITVAAGLLVASPKIGPIFMSLDQSPRFDPGYARESLFFGILSFGQLSSFLLNVKFYFSIYIGLLSAIVVIYMAAARKLRINALLIMFFITAWLFIVDKEGGYSILHQALSSTLPFVKAARLLFFYWFFPMAFLILYLARGVDALIEDPSRKAFLAAVIIFDVILTVVFLVNYDVSLHLRAFITQVALSWLLLVAVYLPLGRGARGALITALVLCDFFVVFGRVNIDRPLEFQGDKVVINITHQNGASTSFKDDELVKNTWEYRITQDKFRPSISESRDNPVLNIGTLHPFSSYTPEAMNWKYFSGLWYNSQERYDFVKLKNSPSFPALHGRPLFSFSEPYGASVSFDKITCSRFGFTVDSLVPGVLRLNQSYDDRWKVFVDQKRRKLLKRDGYFMGVVVQPGRHTVEFVFRDRVFVVLLVVSLITLSALSAVALRDFVKRRRGAGGAGTGQETTGP